jgi:hypothetical protein
VYEGKRTRTGGPNAENRAKPRLVVGIDIPKPEEIRTLLSSLAGRWRPILVTANFHRNAIFRITGADLGQRRS